jgi:hypothetical protein
MNGLKLVTEVIKINLFFKKNKISRSVFLLLLLLLLLLVEVGKGKCLLGDTHSSLGTHL